MAQSIRDVMTTHPVTLPATSSVVDAVGVVSLGDLAVTQDHRSALGIISAAPPKH